MVDASRRRRDDLCVGAQRRASSSGGDRLERQFLAMDHAWSLDGESKHTIRLRHAALDRASFAARRKTGSGRRVTLDPGNDGLWFARHAPVAIYVHQRAATNLLSGTTEARLAANSNRSFRERELPEKFLRDRLRRGLVRLAR